MTSPLNPGDEVAGRYRVERVLGEGGMGVVLAAEHLVLGERVALKLLLPEAARIPGVLQRFQQEARAAMRVQSEHVARVMDVGALDDGTPFLVMEYLEGRDLSQEVEQRGPLPVEEAVSYVLQGAVGVAEAHALGLVHRDLKPSNLFLARLESGRTLVKVLDFGIAKDLQGANDKHLTATHSALGSAPYMSPEQVRLAKSVDARTDVWALGIVLYEVLTGRLPFDGESVTAVAAAIIADSPRPLRELRPEAPAGLEAAIAACLEKDRDRRPATVAALARALEPFGGAFAPVLVARIHQALGVTTGGAPPPSSAAEPQPARTASGPSWAKTQAAGDAPAARRPSLGLLGAAAIVVLSIAAVVWALAGRGSIDQNAAATAATDTAPITSTRTPERGSREPIAVPAASADAGSASSSAARAESAPSSATTTSRPSAAGRTRRVEAPRGPVRGKPPEAPPRKKPLVTDL